jgi:hypothetical protein
LTEAESDLACHYSDQQQIGAALTHLRSAVSYGGFNRRLLYPGKRVAVGCLSKFFSTGKAHSKAASFV